MMLEQRGMQLVAGWWCFWWWFLTEKGQQWMAVAASRNEEEETEKSLDILVWLSFYLVENEETKHLAANLSLKSNHG